MSVRILLLYLLYHLSITTAERPPGKTVAALAAQSFNVPEVPGKMSGWISGFVELPPQVNVKISLANKLYMV